MNLGARVIQPTEPSVVPSERVLTEANGIPISVAVDGANRERLQDGARHLERIPIVRPEPTKRAPQGGCLDKGYDYDEVRDLAFEFGFTAHIRSRGEEAKRLKKTAGFRARRWVVERTHSWRNRLRGLLIRWQKRPETYVAMLHIACGA